MSEWDCPHGMSIDLCPVCYRQRIEALEYEITLARNNAEAWRGQAERDAQALAALKDKITWRAVEKEHPPPHVRYLVCRDGVCFVATPCYGMHEPWWVPRDHEKECPPIPMRNADCWVRASGPERSS